MYILTINGIDLTSLSVEGTVVLKPLLVKPSPLYDDFQHLTLSSLECVRWEKILEDFYEIPPLKSPKGWAHAPSQCGPPPTCPTLHIPTTITKLDVYG